MNASVDTRVYKYVCFAFFGLRLEQKYETRIHTGLTWDIDEGQDLHVASLPVRIEVVI